MLSVVVENPELVHCRTPEGRAYWRLDFDLRLLDDERSLLVALFGVRAFRGTLRSPVRTVRGTPIQSGQLGPRLVGQVVDACRLAGWFERYPEVLWPR